MATFEISEKDQYLSTPLFHDCESAFSLIKEGKEKQAEEMFPLEYYLVQKYLYLDFKDLYDVLSNRLTING